MQFSTNALRIFFIAVTAHLFALQNFSASAEESRTFAPGPALEKRRCLYRAIKEAEKEGVGIKTYIIYFEAIENSVSTSDKKTLVQKLDKLALALGDQLGGQRHLELYLGLNKEQLKTKYCKDVEFRLVKVFQPLKKEINEHCQVLCTIEADGKFKNLRINPEDKSKKATRALVLKNFASIGNLPLPPEAPLELDITICEKPEHVEVTSVRDEELAGTSPRK